MNELRTQKGYTNLRVMRSFRQIMHALHSKKDAVYQVGVLLKRLQRDEERIIQKLERPLQNLKIFEVGPGQRLERARYLTLRNDVTVVDLDVIPRGFAPASCLRMLKKNSFGRLVKTLGRKLLLVDRVNRLAWQKALGTNEFGEPKIIHKDICKMSQETSQFDLAVSWAVFEHLPDPGKALENIIQLIRPGGVLYIGINLYTCSCGHHDIRSITGHKDQLPPWGHLRSSTCHLIHPSAFLNKWRLSQWRELFTEKAPGAEEFLETYDSENHFGWLMTNDLRTELSEYTDEELFTVDVFYLWRKANDLEKK